MADTDDPFRFPVLLGDIGGTNARFAVLHDPSAAPLDLPRTRTADHAGLAEAIRHVLGEAGDGARPRSALIAMAGPVAGGEAFALTNAPWVVRPRAVLAELGLDDLAVLNDFEAQALAVCALDESGLTPIGPARPRPEANRVVLGPGTGLGVAGLLRHGERWMPVGGEGGHVDFGGPRTPRDLALWPHLATIEGRVSAEEVLSGRGLIHLHRAIRAAEGLSPVHDDPAAVTAAAEGGDGAAVETVALFATYLARHAGDLALLFMARGGVHIAGGIIKRILPLVDAHAMRRAFEDKAPHSALLREIPFLAVTAPLAAIAGLAAFARAPDAFAVETAGRRWRAPGR